jgi:hypothetical protein
MYKTEIHVIELQSTSDGTTPWSGFYRNFDAAANNNGCTPGEKAAHLLNALQGRAVDILHSVPTEATYEDMVEALKVG